MQKNWYIAKSENRKKWQRVEANMRRGVKTVREKKKVDLINEIVRHA
jgi:hypothetical protein